MTRWEEAFSKKQKRAKSASSPKAYRKVYAKTPQRVSIDSKQRKKTPAAQPAPPRKDPAAKGKIPEQEKKAKPYPPALKKLRRSLDDVWANILLASKTKPSTLMLCGATNGEGCTFTSFHLSLFLTLEYEMRVLYVDTSTDGSGKHSIIPKLNERPGLAAYFTDDQPLSSLILQSEYPNLFILASGTAKVKGGLKKNIIFKQDSMKNLFSFCRENFDIAIFDGQPITFSPTMIEFAKSVDQVVLVCRYGYTRREISTLAVEKLHKHDVNLLGLIFNDRQYPIPPKVYNLLK